MTQIKVVEIKKSAIDRFCDRWPCDIFPEDLDHIVASFDNGELVDYELEFEILLPSRSTYRYSLNKETIESGALTHKSQLRQPRLSSAMSALLDDAQKFSVRNFGPRFLYL